MKYYCDTIPVSLAEKLKEKGMPNIDIDYDTFDSGTQDQREERWCNNTYAEILDWLMEKGFSCEITRFVDFVHEEVCPEWDWSIEKVGPLTDSPGGYANTWHEAANAAIEKALELI